MFGKQGEAGAERPGGRPVQESQAWEPGGSHAAVTIAVGRTGSETWSVRERRALGRSLTFQAGRLGDVTLLLRHSSGGHPGEEAADSRNPQPWNRNGPSLSPSLYPGPSPGPAPRQALKNVGSREEGEEENARRGRPGEAGSAH